MATPTRGYLKQNLRFTKDASPVGEDACARRGACPGPFIVMLPFLAAHTVWYHARITFLRGV